MSYTTDDIPDLSGRVAVVTGANGGLGLETARALAGANAHVVMAARNQSKAAAARASIEAEHPRASTAIVELDLASQQSTIAAAAKILADHEEIDLLINNAGVMGIPRQETADGFEMQFGVNHLGHWTLTAKLMPAIVRARAARVVTVTSTAHHFGRPVDPANPHLIGNYGAWKAYGQSKLANYHFALGLQREFEDEGLDAHSLAAHPGLSDTDLQARSVAETSGGLSQTFFHRLAEKNGMSPAQGALPQIRAATDPRARGGGFYGPRYVTNGPPVRLPVLRRIGLANAIGNLWLVSERETGVSLEIGDS